ncbi:hypothetical protein JCM17960_19080 [Magnetospira thiophila]
MDVLRALMAWLGAAVLRAVVFVIAIALFVGFIGSVLGALYVFFAYDEYSLYAGAYILAVAALTLFIQARQGDNPVTETKAKPKPQKNPNRPIGGLHTVEVMLFEDDRETVRLARKWRNMLD